MSTDDTSLDDDQFGGPDGLLRSAADAMRSAEEPGWVDISASIQHRLKTVVRRSRPIRAATDAGRLMFVADNVLVSHLRVAVNRLPGAELDRVDLIGDDDTCTGVSIAVATTYGQDIQALALTVRSVAYSVFTDLLGPVEPPFGLEGVDILVIDLTDSDDL